MDTSLWTAEELTTCNPEFIPTDVSVDALAFGPAEIVARFERRGTCAGPLSRGSDAVLDLMEKGYARVVKRESSLTELSEDVKKYTLNRASNMRPRDLPANRDFVSRAREETHLHGEHTESIRLRKYRTPKHKQHTALSKEERSEAIAKRRAEACRTKNWMAQIVDVEYEGLFNGKFGLNKETRESMTDVFSKTMDKVKDVANNNKVVLQHILKLENLSSILSMLVSIMISVIAVKKLRDVSSVFVLLLKLIAGVGIFKTSFSFIESSLDEMMDSRLDDFEKSMTYEQLCEQIEACHMAGVKAPKKLYARRDHLKNHPEDVKPLKEEDAEEVEYEGLLDKPAALSHILSGFINTAVGVGVGFVLSGSQKGGLKKLIMDHKLAGDAKSLLNEIVGFLSKSFDGIFGTSFSRHFVKNSKLESWGSDVAALYEEFAQGRLTDATQGAKRVYQLRMRAIEIKKSDMTMTPSASSYMAMVMQLLSTMENYYGHQGVSPSERMEPVLVCFKGASGIGKSTITPAFIDAILCKSILSKEQIEEYLKNKDSQLYQLLPEEEHVNGYNGQEAVVIEDMGQFQTTKGQKDDMFPIVRFKNTAPTRLNAASLEKKGVLTFTSSLIVANTNLEQFYSPSILLPEAFLRRFDFWIKMIPKKEYCLDHTMEMGANKRRLDRNKCNGVLDTDACEYHLEVIPDFDNPTFITKEVLSWDDLIERVCKLVREQQERHRKLCGARNERIAKIVADMDKEAKRIIDLDCEEEVPEATEIVHEGLFRPVRRLVGALRGRRVSLLARAKATTQALASWFTRITTTFIQRIRDEVKKKWIRRALLAVLVIVSIAFCGKFVSWVFSMIRPKGDKPRKKIYKDPKEFFEHALHSAYAVPGNTGEYDPSTVTKKEWKFNAKQVRKAVAATGSLTMFGATLKCSPEEVDKWAAEYEAELFDAVDPQELPFHVKMAKSITTRNQWHLYAADEDIDFDERVSGGIVTMICGRTGMINAHFIKRFQEEFRENPDSKLRLVQHGNVRRQICIPMSIFADEDCLVVDRERDLALVRFGKYMPVCRDIRPFFASVETTRQNRDFETALIALRTPREVERMELRKRTMSGVVYAQDGTIHNQIFTYCADTIRGDCGSLIMYTGSYANHTERIIGIHMGGNDAGPTKRGFASVLTREVVDGLLARFDEEPCMGVLPVCTESGLIDEETSHLVVRKVDKPVFQPMKTSIQKSLLYGLMDSPSKRPAILNRQALEKAIKKQDALNVTLDEEDLAACARAVYSKLDKCMKHRGMKLTFEEAIVGHPELKSFKKIPRNTSPGWPLCQDPEVRDGKKSILGYDEEYDLDNPKLKEIKQRVMGYIGQLESGKVPEVVFMDLMKDETRPNESVDEMKTRLIAACPLEFTIIYRMYFGAMCNSVIEGRLENECCVGINPLSEEWDTASRLLGFFGKHCVAGDFGSFDNSQTCQAIEATVSDVAAKLTGLTDPKDVMALQCLSVTLSQAQHIVGTKIFENTHGMPSGNPMTTIINCIFGMIMFRMAWLEIMKPHYRTRKEALAGFEDNVKLMMYGDDNIMNISKWAVRWFNQHTLMAVFPRLGLKYTSDVKTDLNPPPFRMLEECTFLKRGFAFHHMLNRWVAPLDKSTILSMLDWTKRGASADSITLDNCNNAMREWVLHGKSYYNTQVHRLAEIVDCVFGRGCFEPLPYKEALTECVNHVPEWVALHA